MPAERVAAPPPGSRASRTRQRLLDCTAELVREVPYRELTTALVTQRLELSPPAFYRYFAGINEAILGLTAVMRADARDLATTVRAGSWTAADAPTTALAVIDACSEFWQRHRPLYRVAGLVADEGDPRFMEVRAATFADLTAAFRDEIAQWKERGKHPADVDPFATACVVVAMLIHTMARESAFGLAGVSPRSLRLHVARVLCATVTGDTVRL